MWLVTPLALSLPFFRLRGFSETGSGHPRTVTLYAINPPSGGQIYPVLASISPKVIGISTRPERVHAEQRGSLGRQEIQGLVCWDQRPIQLTLDSRCHRFCEASFALRCGSTHSPNQSHRWPSIEQESRWSPVVLAHTEHRGKRSSKGSGTDLAKHPTV